MSAERFYAGLELRAEGRRLVGPAVTYGEVSPSHRERFEAGAFDLRDGRTRWLDVAHDPERVIAHTDGGGLELRDTAQALEVAATLPRIPAADKALADVQAGKLRGFSIEFHAEAERRESGIRIVSKAALVGVGLVADPSYPGSAAEVRAGILRASIPFGLGLPCECHKGDCALVEIRDVVIPEGRDVLAIAGNYSRAIGSVSKGTVRMQKDKDGLHIELTPETLETPAGRELAAMSKTVTVVARPVFDQAISKYREIDGVAVYDEMAMKAVLLGPSDNAKGWPEVAIGEAKREAIPEPQPKQSRRVRRWL